MKILLTVAILLFFPEAFAHEATAESKEHRVIKKINLKNKGEAYILAREDGHLLGQPYQVEIRVNCSGKKIDVMDLEVVDSFSVCDMAPDSLKINKQKTAVAMKVKIADLDSYYQEVEDGDSSPKIKCAAATKIKKFSLKTLCN